MGRSHGLVCQARDFRVAFEASADPTTLRDLAELLYGVLPAGRVSKVQGILATGKLDDILDLIDGNKRHDPDPPPSYHGIRRLLHWDGSAQDKAAAYRHKLTMSLTGGVVAKTMIIVDPKARLPSTDALNTWRRRVYGFGDAKGTLATAQAALLGLGPRLPRTQADQLRPADTTKLEKGILTQSVACGQRAALLRVDNRSARQEQWIESMNVADAQMAGLIAAAKIAVFLSDLNANAPVPLILEESGSPTPSERAAGHVLAQALELQRKGEESLTAAAPAVRSLLTEMLAGVQAVLASYGYTPEAPADKLANFNLRVLGRYFRRPTGQEDGRTDHFRPDEWQQRLLNAVDNNRSALIAAPTSSGKTFISFYAMEQVLRGCPANEDKAVYISPTKALVNQVAAEINARFSKSYPHAGAVAGMFTADDRFALDTCQVLVATPQCLEILLLHPTVGEKWRKSLKWVIFDEVHRYVARVARCLAIIQQISSCLAEYQPTTDKFGNGS